MTRKVRGSRCARTIRVVCLSPSSRGRCINRCGCLGTGNPTMRQLETHFICCRISNLLSRRDTYLLHGSNKRSVVRKYFVKVPQCPRHLSPRYASPIGIRCASINRDRLIIRFEERNNFEVSPSGYGIHWPLIDEDLSIDGLIGIVHTPPDKVISA